MKKVFFVLILSVLIAGTSWPATTIAVEYPDPTSIEVSI